MVGAAIAHAKMRLFGFLCHRTVRGTPSLMLLSGARKIAPWRQKVIKRLCDSHVLLQDAHLNNAHPP